MKKIISLVLSLLFLLSGFTAFGAEKSDYSADVKSGSDFVAKCYSTINSNVDDAIKLLSTSGYDLPEIKIALIASGVAETSVTADRLTDGRTYSPQYDTRTGTLQSGTIILNTPENVKIAPYDVYGSNDSESKIAVNTIQAIYDAVDDGCKVINLSLNLSANDTLQQRFCDALIYARSKNVIVVFSGSEVHSDDGFLSAGREYALSVGSVNKYNLIDDYKSYGKINIYATGRDIITYNTDGSLQNKTWSGNAAAAPLVSSICALMLAANPNLTPDEIENILYETGNTIPSSSNNAQECITANAYEALKKITGKSLEKVSLDYSVNYGSNGAELTFFTDDPNAVIYYNDDNADFKLQAPFADSVSAGNKEYTESLLYTNGVHLVTACAYAPGKAKSELEIVMISDNYKRNGYDGFEADDTHPYNYVSDYAGTETTVEVPEFADGLNIEEIGDFCFAGNKNVQTIILPQSIKRIDEFAFANCPNLKTVIAPGVEICNQYSFYNCENLENVVMPKVTVADTAVFKNCPALKTAQLGVLTEINNQAFYGCESLELVKTTADNISFTRSTFRGCRSLTVSTPENSTMSVYAEQNDIPVLGDVQANGSSIRVTDAGLRFGYQYNGERLDSIEEYGFVYDRGEKDNLTVDNAMKMSANNRIDHGDFITFNIVFTDIPVSAYGTVISARAYIKIGGEYFYSDTVTGSFNSVAEKVLADDEIDEKTKEVLLSTMSKEV